MSRIEKFIKNSWLMFDRKIILPYNIFTKTARKGGQGSPPGKNHWLKIVARSLPEAGGYFLCVYVKIATISSAIEVINCNSSYVLIGIPPVQDSGGEPQPLFWLPG